MGSLLRCGTPSGARIVYSKSALSSIASDVRVDDGSLAGFWKSYYAAIIALPAAFILRLLFVQNNPELLEASSAGRIAMVFTLDYVYQWVLFPLAMI